MSGVDPERATRDVWCAAGRTGVADVAGTYDVQWPDGVFGFTPDATQVGTFNLVFVASDGSVSSSETIAPHRDGAVPGADQLVWPVDDSSGNPVVGVACRMRCADDDHDEHGGRIHPRLAVAIRRGVNSSSSRGFRPDMRTLVAPWI